MRVRLSIVALAALLLAPAVAHADPVTLASITIDVTTTQMAGPADASGQFRLHMGLSSGVDLFDNFLITAGDVGSTLVVNADLPCVVPDDLRALEAAIPPGGLALAPAADGTTNALGLSDPRLFRPLYGAGSAERFRTLGDAAMVEVPSLVHDVDTLEDLMRLEERVGPRTQMAVAMAGLVPAT